MSTVLQGLWAFLNSAVGVAILAGIVLVVLNRLYAAKPLWTKYEGAIIAGVKFAEKNIPDDTPNTGLARLNDALLYTLKVYEQVEGKRATSEVEAKLAAGIPIVHAELEAAGSLDK